jgi:hypothetical protein
MTWWMFRLGVEPAYLASIASSFCVVCQLRIVIDL